MSARHFAGATFALMVLMTYACPAAERVDQTPPPNPPQIAGASDEARQAMQGFRLPEGMTVELFAAEPMVANPAAFAIDERGRVYVCETFRQGKGVEDNRNHMHWLHDDLAARTVEDRLAYFREHLGEKVAEYTREDDRIRLLEDTDGDGAADKESVFADGFNGIVEGTGAGVLARNGNVWYTCIPNLWRLRDEDGDGKADVREVLHTGYGVRVAFRGHDLHGLTMGPDGRIYFSIGDRGFNVETREGTRLAMPETGAVFRCEPDGSNLELFAYGLRNPQELAFDDYGNLFTVDNNSDSGDRARLEYIVEGGDYGWRMYYQYLDDRGPWNREMMWYPRDTPPLEREGPGNVEPGSAARDLQPAYIIPPIVNVTDGPSGLTYYPGVGLPDRYDGHFFVADFRGGPSNSGVRSFAVEPDGAGFKMVDQHEFLWSILATDVEFGYDGALYVSDWVNGWNGEGKGRIYRFTHNEYAGEMAESARLMREGFEGRSVEELLRLLEHSDRRIRLEAQFALARDPAYDTANAMANVALTNAHPLARLHAVWALGQQARVSGRGSDRLLMLVTIARETRQTDPQTCAQALKAIGDSLGSVLRNKGDVLPDGTPLLKEFDSFLADFVSHEDLRIQYFGALALGSLRSKRAVTTLFDLLERRREDPLLRHAAVMGLVDIGDVGALVAAAKHPSRSVRLGAVLALRRLERPEVAVYLEDTDSAVVLEAARAINDVPIDAAMPQLAALIERPLSWDDALLRRVMNANFRLGSIENARAVARVAADAEVSESLRLEALAELQAWGEPPPIDRVTGDWRPLEKRSTEGLADVIRPALGGIFSGPDEVRRAGAKLAAKYGIQEVGPVLLALAGDRERAGRVRVEALQALEALKSDKLTEAMEAALEDPDAEVRAEGRRLLAQVQPEAAVAELAEALESGERVERQSAVRVLAGLKSATADKVLLSWLDRLPPGDVPVEIQLDLIEAAQARGTEELRQRVEAYERGLPQDDPLAAYRVALAGGDARRGEEIFFGRSEVSCRRCHKVNGNGGEVGPDLSAIGAQKTREYLLEAIVDPNKEIAKGFETVVIVTAEGKVVVGMVKAEDDENVQLMTAEGALVTIPQEEIDDRAAGKSSMPADLVKHLSKGDVRDLVEYLSTLKQPAEGGGHR